MGDLISREAAVKTILDLCPGTTTEGSYDEYAVTCLCGAAEMIKKLPAVDAAPVVHARWINKNEEGVYGPTYCSVCDFELRIDDMPYCPMCGAKMDRGGEMG